MPNKSLNFWKFWIFEKSNCFQFVRKCFGFCGVFVKEIVIFYFVFCTRSIIHTFYIFIFLYFYIFLYWYFYIIKYFLYFHIFIYLYNYLFNYLFVQLFIYLLFYCFIVLWFYCFIVLYNKRIMAICWFMTNPKRLEKLHQAKNDQIKGRRRALRFARRRRRPFVLAWECWVQLLESLWICYKLVYGHDYFVYNKKIKQSNNK